MCFGGGAEVAGPNVPSYKPADAHTAVAFDQSASTEPRKEGLAEETLAPTTPKPPPRNSMAGLNYTKGT